MFKVSATIGGAAKLGEGVWSATVAPQDLRGFVPATTPEIQTSIVLLPAKDRPDGSGNLTFDPREARVVCIGSTDRTLFLFEAEQGVAETGVDDSREILTHAFGRSVQDDTTAMDAELDELPDDLAQVGRDIVSQVRRTKPGYFQRTSSGRYVYRPNFWTLKVQPRGKSLAITVYGRGSALGHYSKLDIRDDQNSYSRFKVTDTSQVPEAIGAIFRAAQLKGV